MTAAAVIALIAAVLSLGAVVGCVVVLRRVRDREQFFSRELERGRAEFDRIVEAEIGERATALQQTLARERAESMSLLAEEERRIAAERRRDVAERERASGEELSARLVTGQKAIEQRLVAWTSDIEKLQEGLAEEVRRIEGRQRQLTTEIEARIGKDAEGLQGQLEDQRVLVARQREDLARTAQAVAEQANAELEQHSQERRRALQEVGDRLRRRETELKEVIDRESAEATIRITSALADIERRHIEQLQRVVARETQRYTEAAYQSFDTTIRAAREDAARRLSRELDLAVDRFAREAEGTLAERLNAVSDAAGKRMEERLALTRNALERQRDEVLRSLGERTQSVETGLRERLREIALDAESERGVLEARLGELQRRLDEIGTRT